MQYHAIPCNTMQYLGCLITADGAYHCPVGSIWPFLTNTLYNSNMLGNYWSSQNFLHFMFERTCQGLTPWATTVAWAMVHRENSQFGDCPTTLNCQAINMTINATVNVTKRWIIARAHMSQDWPRITLCSHCTDCANREKSNKRMRETSKLLPNQIILWKNCLRLNVTNIKSKELNTSVR